jgi:hypothetical protein
MMKLPAMTYIAIGDFGPKLGQGFIGENLHSFWATRDAVSDWLDDTCTEYRVICMETCPDTNLVEHTTDVTEEIAAALA